MSDQNKDQAVWAALGNIRHSAVVTEARVYAEDVARRRAQRRAVWQRLFVVPSLAAAAALIAAMVLWPAADRFETGVGEMRTATLPDGSTVTLNTATEIAFAFTDGERRVNLLKGEAHFDVAHDTARPFRVAAGPMTVTAIGTAFDVAALPSRTAVTLIEGKVVVQSAASPEPTTLAPGEQLVVAADGFVKPKTVAKLDTALAWQRSLVDINDLTLADALAEVNRYSETKVTVRDASLKDRRVSGVFRTGDVEAVALALRTYFGLQIVSRSKTAIVLDKAG